MASYTLADKQTLVAVKELWVRLDSLHGVFGNLHVATPDETPVVPYAVASCTASANEATRRHWPGVATGTPFRNTRTVTIACYCADEDEAEEIAAVLEALSPLPRSPWDIASSFPSTVTFVSMTLDADPTIEDTTDVNGFWTVIACYEVITTRVIPAVPT